MSSPVELTPNIPDTDSSTILGVRLYIAGGALNSMRALINLKVLCERYFPSKYQIEVIDIFEDPQRALADNVLVTPTLIKISPAPIIRLVGDLSHKQTVLLALQSGTYKL